MYAKQVTVLFLASCVANLTWAQESPKNPAPLFQNLGKHHFPVSTQSRKAQQYFDQGMILLYGFNHQEAIRSFQAAATLDPDCAMAYWGVALAYGPNINAPMSEEAVPKAWQALQKARKLAPGGSKREQAYIQALAKRYTEKPVKDRKELDQAFARAMAEVWKNYPDDLDAATLYAEALMDTRPWDYWARDGQPQPGTREILAALEHVLKHHPNHPGANHYYIHAVEASPHPELGLPSAHRLVTLSPGAGHLVHMPSHIFLRLGMYHEATEVNEKAIAADESYITACKVQGFYPLLYYSHNVHFLWYCLSMEGRSDYGLRAGKKTAAMMDRDGGHGMPEAPEEAPPMLPFMQWLKATPLFSLVRFGRWEEILEQPQPEGDAPFVTAMWHYARGMALARKKQPEKAREELARLQKIAGSKKAEALETPEFPGLSVMRLAGTILEAEVEGRHERSEKRLQLLEKAVQLQDDLPYMEPPFWYFPTRQLLGAALLEHGYPEKAEKVYREDLKRHPRNGWSLFGLLQCLRVQGRAKEAQEVQQQFQDAWRHADVTLTGSCF